MEAVGHQTDELVVAALFVAVSLACLPTKVTSVRGGCAVDPALFLQRRRRA
jgi:hypothetical protein